MAHPDPDGPNVTAELHDTSWSVDLEGPEHADAPDAVIEGALEAIGRTVSGNHVNVVTHGELGHPETYLYPVFEDELAADVEWTYVDRCGCGGYVTRVHV